MATRRYPPPAEGYPLKLFGGRVPKAALYGQDLTLWGDGTYSNNVVQGGVTLQPQIYNLAGVGVLTNCIVVTGEATVAPDAQTGASVVMGQHLVAIGPSASLKPSTNSKGLILLFNKGIYARDGGKISTDKLGKAGDFGNLTAYDLVPEALQIKIKKTAHDVYVVQGEGAAGGVQRALYTDPVPTGAAAIAMQTGGGGAGGGSFDAVTYTVFPPGGNGGKGGPCCGGAGGGAGGQQGAGGPGGYYGGPGGAIVATGSYPICGSAGDPVGESYGNPAAYPQGAGGGLLMIFTPTLEIAAGCVISADGADGGNAVYPGQGGGSAGGGCVVIVTKAGGYTNLGTVRASGGASMSGDGRNGAQSGGGGVGSANTFTV